MQMRDTARASLLSLPAGGGMGSTGSNSNRSTVYSRDGFASDDSNLPMLQNNGTIRSSGLRHQHYAESEETDYDTSVEGVRYRNPQAL